MSACCSYFLVLLAWLYLGAAHEFLRLGRQVPPTLSVNELPEYSEISTSSISSITNGSDYFVQWLDHRDPSKGTFKMRYWWNAEYWGGPGSPIVFLTPGESAGAGYTGYLTNHTITGLFAQRVKGAVVMAEHRYWGDSSPYTNLTTTNLQYLTLNQSIMDFVYFARNVQLPFDPSGRSTADNAPWIYSGGSYAGALAAWTSSVAPGTFWAYHASSAPVQSINDYWQYFVPVEDGMPQNCSMDVSRVINYLDDLMMNGSESEKLALKKRFGLESLKHDDDFMSMLENGPWLWQSNSFSSGYSKFYQFCDAVENVEAEAERTPGKRGVGLKKALAGYANWSRTTLVPGYCQAYGYTDPMETACMDTYNASNLIYTNHAVDNPIDRQWIWMLCNEPLSFWQDGAPPSRPTLVSRLVTAAYWQRQCPLFFPSPPASNDTVAGPGPGPDPEIVDINDYTKGWNTTETKRIVWTNGQYDPWRTSSMSSEFRPSGPYRGSLKQPVHVIQGGFHCSDLKLSNAQANFGVNLVVVKVVQQMEIWINEYYAR